MTAIQLNAELYRAMGEIADNETLMAKVLKYVKKLAAQQKADPTMMTKEEFFAKLERGEEEYRQGKTHRMLPGEDLDDFLMSKNGYKSIKRILKINIMRVPISLIFLAFTIISCSVSGRGDIDVYRCEKLDMWESHLETIETMDIDNIKLAIVEVWHYEKGKLIWYEKQSPSAEYRYRLMHNREDKENKPYEKLDIVRAGNVISYFGKDYYIKKEKTDTILVIGDNNDFYIFKGRLSKVGDSE